MNSPLYKKNALVIALLGAAMATFILSGCGKASTITSDPSSSTNLTANEAHVAMGVFATLLKMDLRDSRTLPSGRSGVRVITPSGKTVVIPIQTTAFEDQITTAKTHGSFEGISFLGMYTLTPTVVPPDIRYEQVLVITISYSDGTVFETRYETRYSNPYLPFSKDALGNLNTYKLTYKGKIYIAFGSDASQILRVSSGDIEIGKIQRSLQQSNGLYDTGVIDSTPTTSTAQI